MPHPFQLSLPDLDAVSLSSRSYPYSVVLRQISHADTTVHLLRLLKTTFVIGSPEASIAIAALVIALFAFFIACGQLLQQLFTTADDLRQCQESVIGGWSQLVQLRFRWYACCLQPRSHKAVN
jgi:hypothetical protein